MEILFDLALPKNQDTPPVRDERVLRALISSDIRFELCEPEVAIARRCRRPLATRVTMPEASVNKDCPFATSVRDIGRTGKIAVVNAKPVAECMEESADGQLCRGAVLPDAAETC